MIKCSYIILFIAVSCAFCQENQAPVDSSSATPIDLPTSSSPSVNSTQSAEIAEAPAVKQVAISPPSKSKDKLFVGLAKFTGEGLNKVEMQAVTSKFQDEMLAINKVQLMEQAQMDALLQEKGLQESGCVRSTCLVEMGTTLGVEQLVFGTINKVGNVFTIIVKMVDVQTGKTVKSTMFDTEDKLDLILKKHLRTVAENILGKADASEGTYAFDQKISQKTAAVLEIEAAGLTDTEKRGLTERLRAELFNTGKLDVMEREMMNMILQEQDFQQSDMCNNEGCLVKVGQLVGVDYMVGGSVARIGDLYSVSARLIDVGTGKIVRTASTETRGSLEDVLKTSTNDVARSLVGLKMRERTNVAAWSWLGGGALLGIGSGVTYYLAWQKYYEYHKDRKDPENVGKLNDTSHQYFYASYGLSAAAALCASWATYKFLTFGNEVKVQTMAFTSPQISQVQVAVGF